MKKKIGKIGWNITWLSSFIFIGVKREFKQQLLHIVNLFILYVLKTWYSYGCPQFFASNQSTKKISSISHVSILEYSNFGFSVSDKSIDAENTCVNYISFSCLLFWKVQWDHISVVGFCDWFLVQCVTKYFEFRSALFCLWDTLIGGISSTRRAIFSIPLGFYFV